MRRTNLTSRRDILRAGIAPLADTVPFDPFDESQVDR
jgi:hypothetical protein